MDDLWKINLNYHKFIGESSFVGSSTQRSNSLVKINPLFFETH